jgi:deoxyribonuclease-4
MNLGAHMSIAGGVHRALERGRRIGCDAVQLFVKNTSQWRLRPLGQHEIHLFLEERRSFPRNFVVAHGSYLVNLASPDEKLLERSLAGFGEEMKRARTLDIPYILTHPGSHRGSGATRGVRRVAKSLDRLVATAGAESLMILLETTAGQGDTLGRTFEELARIIDATNANEALGVCFDTCHVFAAGYDLRTRRAYESTLRAFDRIVGLDRLHVFHLNDSLRELGSTIDRHTHIGKGKIGLDAFSFLVNDERFLDRPMILETPKGADDRWDIQNLAVLRGLRVPVNARGRRAASRVSVGPAASGRRRG